MGYMVGIADHGGIGGDGHYKLNTISELERYISYLSEINACCGLEVDAGVSDIPDNLVPRFDYIILSAHHILVDRTFVRLDEFFHKKPEDPDLYWRNKFGIKDVRSVLDDTLTAIITGLETGKFRILGHATMIPLISLQDENYKTEWGMRLLDACWRNNVAVELNNYCKAPESWFMDLAVKFDIVFSIGSDGHREHQVCDISYPLECISRYKIRSNRIFGYSLEKRNW
ncbi:hypothetical protein DRQ15_06290 [candidate division KSB1 bacterium]|nr:MAG: hypothetical protein DRQ15_06290 [candidate division KSB1 bacterium]